MSGFVHLLRWDLVTQVRYGFWLAGLGVALVWALILQPLPPDYLRIWLPIVLYFDIGVIGLMFVPGVLFFERRQGVLDALVVTPIRTSDWLGSKVLSLSFLATVVAAALVLVTVGPGADWPRLVPCFALVAALYTLFGFHVAARFQSISGFLAAFGLVGLPLALPILQAFGIGNHPLMWVNPAYPTMVLVRQAFEPGSLPELTGALLLTALWIGVAFGSGVDAFHRRVSWRRGAA